MFFECALHRVDWCLVCLSCLEPEAEYEYENEVTTEVENEELDYDPIDNSSGKMTEPR